MKLLLVLPAALLILTGCTTQQRSPDAIRQETAHATSQATRDAKAVVQGVYDGLKEGGTVNINKAPADKLETLPGIDELRARRIIDHRPYDTSYDLVKKQVLTKSEYDKIAGKIAAH
ncbi:MAG: ComEA family DNA-binding protein [Acidobacteriota bacterium]